MLPLLRKRKFYNVSSRLMRFTDFDNMACMVISERDNSMLHVLKNKSCAAGNDFSNQKQEQRLVVSCNCLKIKGGTLPSNTKPFARVR